MQSGIGAIQQGYMLRRDTAEIRSARAQEWMCSLRADVTATGLDSADEYAADDCEGFFR